MVETQYGIWGGVSSDDVMTIRFWADAEKHGYTRTIFRRWQSDANIMKDVHEEFNILVSLDFGTELMLDDDEAAIEDEEDTNSVRRFLASNNHVLVYVTQSADGVISFFAAGRSQQSCEDALETFIACWPPVTPPLTGVTVSFLYNTEPGVGQRRRSIQVPAWPEIAENYTNADKIKPLLDLERPQGRGKIILLHGAPGTGKTYAVRSLIREWASWCHVSYITDPESFFSNARYMMTAFTELGDYYAHIGKSNIWELVICEDVGELMTGDAKDRTGQALSRLLNLTEGLIGQGVNMLVLMTTNESLKSLHPAISRPGRCLAEIEFTTFTAAEANRWLAEHGCEEKVTKSQTLADLFAILNNSGTIRSVKEPVGIGLR